MRRSLPKTGVLISGVVLLVFIQLALLAALFKDAPKQHSEAFIAAQEGARRNPTAENLSNLGRMVKLELDRPSWKDPVSVEYYCTVFFAIVVNSVVVTRLLRRIRLPREPIRTDKQILVRWP